ncbi:tRNA nucleotidyltransferase [Pseudoalteromonas sp. NEC-BIFX-2020_015]|uniref:tRNA nucleotidyltransferase n=1 Tax=Pseudoalteromonas sp. NEC-BIFX-2020_015 TaxID=2729544 RepID=UPI0014614F16|nr:tRNA nucleotidyltransferase [Pseudoalteromonas sp. NEC-BIFX-2020_015]NMR24452.1 tRNA nucleotidyltransferase [Pseudoalteromonas sp. NEC-BIFX-2020_015]
MQVYLVGGAVRDELLGRVIKERDYVIVGATSEQLLKQGYQQVGKDFPVFLHPQTKDEYALARTERKQGKGYTGFVCEFSPDVTLEDDLRRRDLTVNAIAKAEDGSLIDPYHGKRDLDARILRHVSQAFSEDPLRILRIARFAARYHYLGFTIAKETQSLLKAMVERGELNTLTPERIWLECEKSLTDGAFDHFLNTLAHLNALSVISPALANIWNDQLFQKLQARFKYAKKYNITDNALLFSQITSKLNSDEISAIAKAIRLPNDVRDLALHASQHQDVLTSATIHPEQLLFSCNKLDLWRRPERFSAVLKAIEIANCSVIKNQQLLLQASKEARAINPKQFIDQGIKGADIKTALEHARLEVFKRYFR